MNGVGSGSTAQFLISHGRDPKNVSNPVAKEDAGLKKAAADFESLFVNQLLSTMRETVTDSELLPNNHGEKMFRSMLDQEYAQKAAKNGSLGLGKMIYEELRPKLGS